MLDDALQQQRVLGEPLHLGDDEVSELQPPALRVAFSLLDGRTHRQMATRGQELVYGPRARVGVKMPNRL